MMPVSMMPVSMMHIYMMNEYMMYVCMMYIFVTTGPACMCALCIYDACMYDAYIYGPCSCLYVCIYDESTYVMHECMMQTRMMHEYSYSRSKASIFAKIVIRSVVCLRSSVDSNAAFSLHLNYDAIN